MYTETLAKCSANALRIKNLLINHPLSFWISGMMAGAYVGLGIILIFTLGNQVDESIRSLVMGATFGIALTLVIIAGAELFTGHTMYLTVGLMSNKLRFHDLVKILPQTWLANLLGSILVAALYALSGYAQMADPQALLHKIALAKVSAPTFNLLMKGILCNWLVCLAIWMALRVEGAAKFIAICWCLLGFIASGYEHSIANMTLFSLSWFGNHTEAYTLGGIGHNLLWVTIGNTISGVAFMGLGYWFATPKEQRPEELVSEKQNEQGQVVKEQELTEV